jgi:hypothetical protein
MTAAMIRPEKIKPPQKVPAAKTRDRAAVSLPGSLLSRMITRLSLLMAVPISAREIASDTADIGVSCCSSSSM